MPRYHKTNIIHPYNEVNWTFLNDNKTHYKSIFKRTSPTSAILRSLQKPRFETGTKEYKKQEFDESFLTDKLKLEEKTAKKYQKYLEGASGDEGDADE